jgi:hypothetical protein
LECKPSFASFLRNRILLIRSCLRSVSDTIISWTLEAVEETLLPLLFSWTLEAVEETLMPLLFSSIFRCGEQAGNGSLYSRFRKETAAMVMALIT